MSCRSAVVNEIVPLHRTTANYFRRRYRRIGQNQGRDVRSLKQKRSIAKAAGVAVVSLMVFSSYPTWKMFSGAAMFMGLSKFWYNVGTIEGLLGLGSEIMNDVDDRV